MFLNGGGGGKLEKLEEWKFHDRVKNLKKNWKRYFRVVKES